MKIEVVKSLLDKPRPHYLTGEAEYTAEKGFARLLATAYFSSGNPSIADRLQHEIPHVNIGDAYFALWNGIHIIGEQEGFGGTLTGEGRYKAKRPIPADTPIRLDVTMKEIPLQNRKIPPIFDLAGEFEGVYTLDDKELLRLWGTGFAKKLNRYFL